jgi:uncharacterized protein
MKKRLNPTQILLRELPPEGREYEYNRDSGELNDALDELIDQNDYSVRLTVRPIGNAFDVSGDLKTTLNLQCSLCAIDFKLPISQKIHEVLVINDPLHKGDHLTKANHSSEWDPSQPEGVYLEAPILEVGEFIHELIAIAEPMRPLGRPGCEEACENRKDGVQREWLSVGAKDSISVRNHPFSILEKIKLKS